MITIGLTGGMGSGKSFIAEIFTHLNIPVFNADKEAKSLYNQEVIRHQMSNYFGGQMYDETGINTALLAKEIFNNPEKLQFVTGIIHPALAQRFFEWTDRMAAYSYVIKEAAILFETGSYRELDLTILVTSPEQLRIQRIKKRDGLSDEEIHQRLKQQWPDEQKVSLADFVIHNNEQDMLLPQVLAIHQQIIEKAHG